MQKAFFIVFLVAILSACAPAPSDAGKPVVYKAAQDQVQQAILEVAPNHPYNRDLAVLRLLSVRPGEVVYQLDNAQNIGSRLLFGQVVSRAVFTLYSAGGVTYVTGSGSYTDLIQFVFKELDKRFERVSQP